MIKKSESLKKKGGCAGKTKATWADGMDTVEKNLELILQMLEWLDPLEEKHTGWKEIEMTNSMIEKD